VSRRPSRFAGFNTQSLLLWVLAAVIASVAVWLAPSRPAPAASAPESGELVFFELPDNVSTIDVSNIDAGAGLDASPGDAAP